MAGLADLHDSLERPFCDAVISIHGVQFKVHKFILCGCSTYFRDLFLHHSAPDKKEFEVPDLSAATMQLIIEFAYTGSVSVTEENMQELLQAAKQFIITGIEQACCNSMAERLSSENCIGVWQFCNIRFHPELQQKAYRYLMIHFEEVLSKEEFQQLSVQDLSGILDSDELNVRQESFLYEAICKWVAYEPAERQQHWPVLLSKVRLALTSESFITDLLKTEALSSNAECLKIVQQAGILQSFILYRKPRKSICYKQSGRPRLPNTILFAIGYDFYTYERITEVYDFHADRWNTVSVCDGHYHRDFMTVDCNGSLYCVGGNDEYGPTNVVYILDLATHTSHEVAPMHHCRNDVSVTVLDGLIYAMGGSDGRQGHSSAERYDPQTNQWSFIASMHEIRINANCTVLHNMIYICGGHSDITLNTCECYCPETAQWTMLTSMSFKRFGHGVIAYEDQIFAVGGHYGYHTLNGVEAYDPSTKTWKDMPSMLTPRRNFGIAVIDKKLFAVGGYPKEYEGLSCTPSHKISRVECYDMSTKLWSKACPMEDSCYHPSCFVWTGLPDVAKYVIRSDKPV